MGRERTNQERLSDNAILLTLCWKSQKHTGADCVGDRLKVMKLAFIATYKLYWDEVKAINLGFHRYTYGPYTEQINDNRADLANFGLLVDSELISVTEEGARFAECFEKEVLRLDENKSVLNVLNQVVEEYSSLTTAEVLSKVYKMWCFTLDSPGRKHEVEKTPIGKEYTRVLEEKETKETLYIPKGWQTTLELSFAPHALRNLQKSIDDTFSGQLHGWEAFNSNV